MIPTTREPSSSCPGCGISWESDKTVYEALKELYPEKEDSLIREIASWFGHTEETPKHFGINVIGVEIREVYDGVLYWECEECGHKEHR